MPDFDSEELENTSLWSSLSSRRTCRDFDGKPVPIKKIATLLYCAFAEVNTKTDLPDLSVYGYKRTSPSAGGLQSTEPYLWAINIEGLAPGIYHYLSQRHELEYIDELPKKLGRLFMQSKLGQ